VWDNTLLWCCPTIHRAIHRVIDAELGEGPPHGVRNRLALAAARQAVEWYRAQMEEAA
jgi:hypothetical protein